MSTKRQFMDEGVASATSVCPDTGSKFHLRMFDKNQGRIDIYTEFGDTPVDTWNLSRSEMKALFRVLSKPCKD